jgi:two-component system, OmpR family, sensor histidine kinase KdpD
MRRLRVRRAGLLLAVAVPSLAGATIGVALLEHFLHLSNASVVYLTAVVATAIVAGTPGAIVAAVASFLLYDFFFTEPYLTFTIRDPSEWLGVTLLLFVGIVVGQLAALQRSRAEDASAREREARALFGISRELANRTSTPALLPTIARVLQAETAMERVWIALGSDDASERIAADTGGAGPAPVAGRHRVLRRMPGDEPAQWVLVHQAGGRQPSTGGETYRVRIAAGTATLGSIWALRDRGRGEPDRPATRLLSAAADQIGQALAHDRLAAEAQAAEIARQSDALKSALLQSVSHDLRTPLATIRAAAGTLRPGTGLSPSDQQESAEAIDREVEYLNRLVTNLLDLSRIEAGALRAERDVFELDDVAGRTIDRLRARLAGRPLRVDLAAPPVQVDPVFLDDALVNIVDNAIKYTPPGTPLEIVARELPGEGYVRLTVEDGGSGVPADALGRLFDKFYRVPGGGRASRSGTGIGLAVVRGLVEATGGRVSARPGRLGGLAVDLDLPMASVPADLVAGPHA